MNKMIKGAFVGTAIAMGSFLAACSESTPVNSDVAGDAVNVIQERDFVGEIPQESQSLVAMSKTDLDFFNSYMQNEMEECDPEIDESCDEEEETYPKKAISLNKTKDKFDKSVDVVEICYTKLESPDAEEATVCPINLDGSDLPVKFYLVAGSTFAESGYVLEYGKVHFGGIDLTEGLVIRKKKILTPVGRYTLFVVVDGSLKKVASFRRAGDLEVIPGDAVAHYFDYDDKEIAGSAVSYEFVGTGVVAEELTLSNLVPVYISAIAGEKDGKYYVQPCDAMVINYKMSFEAPVHLYKKQDVGTFVEITQSSVLTTDESGVDTLYAAVFAKDIQDETYEAHLRVVDGSYEATIVFTKP